METQVLDKILEALQDLGATKQQVSSHEQTIKDLEGRLRTQETITSVTNTNVCQIKESLNDFKVNQQASNEKLLQEIQALKDKPGKRWDNLISSVIAAVIGILFGRYTK